MTSLTECSNYRGSANDNTPLHPTDDIAVLRKILPREYFRRFLKDPVHPCRPDGRGLEAFRTISLSPGGITTATSSAYVTIGRTTVLCAAKAEVTVPTAEQPAHGMLVPNIELPPLCSTRFHSGPPGQMAQSIAHALSTLVTRTPLIEPSALCIEPGVAVWVVYLDILCLSYDGSVLDAATAAMSAALNDLRLPDVTYDAEEGSVRGMLPRGSKPTPLARRPIACSFSSLDGVIICDPTAEEERLLPQTFSIIMDTMGATSETEGSQETPSAPPRDILSIVKCGGDPVSLPLLKSCIALARARARNIARSAFAPAVPSM